MKLFTGVGLGWLGRAAGRIGGTVGGLSLLAFDVYSRLPPSDQAAVGRAIQQIFTGRWKEVTFGTAALIVGGIFMELRGYKATVKPAVVTSEGTKTALNEVAPTTRRDIEAVANTAAGFKPDGPIVRRLKRIFGN